MKNNKEQAERNYKASECALKGIKAKWNVLTVASAIVTVMLVISFASGILEVILGFVLGWAAVVGTKSLSEILIPIETEKKTFELKRSAALLSIASKENVI